MTTAGPPRPGGSGPLRPGATAGPTGSGPGPGTGSPLPARAKAASKQAVFATFVVLSLTSLLSAVMTRLSWGNGTPTVPMWIGFLGGLFGCTICFGVLQFFVNQQMAAGSFTDWRFAVSRMTVARVLTFAGWLGGGVNCYLLAHHFARFVA